MPQSPEQIQAAIIALDAQRAMLGDAVVDAALASLRRELATLQAPPVEAPRQQLKQVSVLFVDVVGSTAIGQQLSPEEIHAVMDGALERFTRAVAQHHGRVLQYTGDGMLAAFGSQVAHEDDVENAVRAGLAILEQTRAIAPEVARRHRLPEFNVRAGVHTGTVLLGAGVDADASIRGAAVNVAARMEQSAPPGRLRISHDSWRHVRGLFEATEQAPIQVKGVEEPLRSYLVERVRPRAFRVPNRGIDGVATQMVGRVAELMALTVSFDIVKSSGQARALTIVGDAGLGKSRLLAEFQRTLNVQDCWLLLGRAHPRSALQPFGLLRDALARQFHIGDGDAAEAARAKLVGGLLPLVGTDAEGAVHLLGHLIGLDFSDSGHVRDLLGDEAGFRREAFDAAAVCLRRLASRRPVVVMLDDLHWADLGTLEFVRHMLAANRDTPLLALMLSRPVLLEQHPDWIALHPDDAWLNLQPLDKLLADALAAQLLQRLPEVPAALRSMLTGGAEGNPFYMEELVRMLIDDGVIVADGDRWRVQPDKLLGARVPPTLTGVLQARLDALPWPLRQALQQAAVVGHVFWDRALAAIDPQAPAALPQLLRKGLVHRHDTPAIDDTREYAFQHHLLHQVTYDAMLSGPRREAHARAGAFWTGRAEVASPHDVTPASCRALAEAQHHGCRADPQAWADWFDGQFSHYLNAYAARALRPLAEQMVQVSGEQFGAEDPHTARALTNLARVLIMQGGVDQAEPLLRRALASQELALAADHPDVARTLAVLGGCHSGRGDLAGAEPYLRRALGIRERALGPDHPLTLSTLDNLAKVTLELGRLDEAEALNRKVLAHKESSLGAGHPDTAFAQTALGEVLYKQGRHEAAEGLIRQALDVQLGLLGPDHPETGLSMWHLSEVLRRVGVLDEAESLARRALDNWEASFGPDHEWTAWAVLSLAETRLAQGAPTEAADLAARAAELVRRVYGAAHAVVASALALHGRALLAAGDLRQAVSVLERAVQVHDSLAPARAEDAEATRALLAKAREAACVQ